MKTGLTRALLLALALGGGGVASMIAVGTPAMAQGTARDPAAEQFVQGHARTILSILATSGSVTHNPAFDSAVEQFVDVPRITRFVLGKYGRTATPDQIARFTATFRTYAETVYQKRLFEYARARLNATGSVVRKPGDVLVTTTITGVGSSPAILVWRVLGSGAAMKVVDVQVGGVWLSITQQQDFVSTIDNAGGRIDVLIAQLVQDAQSGTARRK